MERESKFNVSKDTEQRTYNGIVFDSVMEMRFYRDVVLPQVESGQIVRYELQKPYVLQPEFVRGNATIRPITYVADFYLEFADGRSEVIETKGCPDSLALAKRKMFWYHYPDVEYRWVCYSKIDGGWCDYEAVKKARKQRKKEKLLKLNKK